ncbi:MAG: hypothetical protein COV48_03025, partial [Elusimicrobia bacterium CG11_big_fil_rev_8_21_14_0_20_64_6]
SDTLEAANGRDALRLIQSEKPSLVLLDIAMPEMDGYAVLKAALELVPTLYVVMLTGQQDIKVIQRFLEAGARAYITKPFDPKVLRSEVGRVLDDLTTPSDSYRPWRIAPS